jgi:putrescine transport system permease protein
MNGFGRGFRAILIGFPFAWLALFFLLPLAIVAGISFTDSADAVPPYTPLWTRSHSGIEINAMLANYTALCQGCLRAYGESIG